MTPEKIAKALVRHIERGTLHEFGDLVKHFTNKIQEACDEAREEALELKGVPQMIAKARNDWYAKGFSDAREQAAKKVQKWIDGDCVGPNPANVIRSLEIDK